MTETFKLLTLNCVPDIARRKVTLTAYRGQKEHQIEIPFSVLYLFGYVDGVPDAIATSMTAGRDRIEAVVRRMLPSHKSGPLILRPNDFD
jgi:hypothetical protein